MESALEFMMCSPEPLDLNELLFEYNYEPENTAYNNVPVSSAVRTTSGSQTAPEFSYLGVPSLGASGPYDAPYPMYPYNAELELARRSFMQSNEQQSFAPPATSSVSKYDGRAPLKGVSTTPPTPPQSPPSSSSEFNLDHLIASLPEILEGPRPYHYPDFEDVLLDLKRSPCGQTSPFPVEEVRTVRKTQEQQQQHHHHHQVNSQGHQENYPREQHHSMSNTIPKALKKDSMWGSGRLVLVEDNNQRLKTRTISESSEEYRLQGVYSDEEYEHLPDTPCGSDEDGEQHHLDAKEVSSNLNNVASLSADVLSSTSDSTTTTTTPSASQIYQQQSSPQYSNSVSSEHNYCEKTTGRSWQSLGMDSDEDDIDVISCDGGRDSSSEFGSVSPSGVSATLSTALPGSSSNQVKRQLQMAIQESLKNKQKRGRVGRPPKSPKEMESSPAHFSNVELICDAGILTLGKPASYTKRMREQHHELVLKSSKRRKTSCRNPGEELEKRSNHNIMERNRRVNIKNLFDGLRTAVPELQQNERASKVLILNKSREFIEQMEVVSSRLSYEKGSLLQANQILKRKLESLLP